MPILGPIYSDLISGHYLLVYVAFIMVAVTAYVLFRTRFGLRLRAVGENPKAVDTAGISVVKLRYQAVIITGLLCGLAGAYFSIAQGSGFGNNMTAGKGYHRAGRADLRQVEAGAGHVHLPAVRLPRCAADPPAERATVRHRRFRCRPSRRCPMC